MKNKEFLKLLKKNRSNSNSGFTLTELLVGLVMGTIVVGGLGFGLVNLLRNTQTQTAFSEARNNSSRALDFISDEVKRAVAIENTAANANGFNSSADKIVVFALDIPEIAGNFDEDGDGNLLGVDNNATNTERIVYFLQDVKDMPTGTPWQGPLVLHRWGPALDIDGDYSDNNGNAWQAEALIDGINDTALASATCNRTPGLVTTPANPTGFYACIQDDDQDGIVEDGTTDTNGDGVVDANDSNEDVNGAGIAAQLFLTSGVDIGRTNNDTYTANTQVVARARVAPANNSNNFVSYTMSYRTLGAVYNCNPGDNSTWSMRTDFGNNPGNDDDTLSWVHQANRQPQPITINTANDLAINTTPVQPLNATINPLTGVVDCLSKGDETATVNTANEPISEFSDGTRPNGHTIPFTMKFVDSDDASTANNWHTFNGDPKTGTRDEPDVKGDGTVLILKQGSVISASLTGYDFDQDGKENQDSLGKFLESQQYATFDGTNYTITSKLQKDERIMAVEVGQTDSTHPGWDVQDSVIILSSDVFAEKYN